MTTQTTTIPVDLTNPGQFFACCGLLELASRIDSSAHARFANSTFEITSQTPVLEVLAALRSSSVNEITVEGDRGGIALSLNHPFDLRLDWWMDHFGNGYQLATWSGRQSIRRVFGALREATAGVQSASKLFEFEAFVRDPENPKKKKSVSPLYIDTRRSFSTQDLGFSPDAHDMSFYDYPAVESLALIGLQRFRPAGTHQDFVYRAWADPLDVIVAPAAAAGTVSRGPLYKFSCIRRVRDYFMYSRATLERNPS